MTEAGDGLTLRGILFEQEGDAGLRSAVHEGGGAESVDGRLGALSPGLRRITRDEVITVIAGVLDLELIDVLAAGWRKWEELVGAARRSLEPPGHTEIVELIDHRITSTHRPHVEVVLDGKQVAQIGVQVEVGIELHALTAVIAAGRLAALRSGRADVSAELAIEDVQIAHASRRVELPIEIALGAGITLVGPPDVVILPPAPAGEQTTAR